MVHLSHLTEGMMTDLAERLADVISSPTTVCLWGDLGAGKTTFARFFIQRLLESAEDIPSPTFTLVQTYNTIKGEVWHCDLYRLNSSMEVEELGLLEAFHQAVCLIEWPEKLQGYLPKNRLDLHLRIAQDQTRIVEVTAHGSCNIDAFVTSIQQRPLESNSSFS